MKNAESRVAAPASRVTRHASRIPPWQTLFGAHLSLIAFSTLAMLTILNRRPGDWMLQEPTATILPIAWRFSGPLYVSLGALAAVAFLWQRIGGRRTSLVFLSACETAVENAAGNGSELISLAEAFAMAGPPTLVATLWKVDDEATSRLVLGFYSELAKGRTDTLEALRTAQLALLKDKDFALPYFWAPFVMMGSWR